MAIYRWMPVVLLFACVGCAAESKESVKTGPKEVAHNVRIPEWGVVPIGRLGHQFGTYVTVEGIGAEGGLKGARTLMIEKVNGVKQAVPIRMWVENIDLPRGQKVVIKGYEMLKLIGMPPAYHAHEKEMGLPLTEEEQAAWQTYCSFVALRVIEPTGLKIQERQ